MTDASYSSVTLEDELDQVERLYPQASLLMKMSLVRAAPHDIAHPFLPLDGPVVLGTRIHQLAGLDFTVTWRQGPFILMTPDGAPSRMLAMVATGSRGWLDSGWVEAQLSRDMGVPSVVDWIERQMSLNLCDLGHPIIRGTSLATHLCILRDRKLSYIGQVASDRCRPISDVELAAWLTGEM
jgi:hypothetical protein